VTHPTADGESLGIVACVDTLTDVLTLASVRGSVAASVAGGGDWGLRLHAVPGAAFHAITAGVAYLVLDSRQPLQLLPGDLVLLPGGSPHILAGRPDAPARPFDHARAEAALRDGDELAVGEPPATTRILCASYHHDPAATLATFSLLPDVLHVTALAAPQAVRTSLQLLADELRHPGPGSRAVLDHVVNILLIQLLRSWIADLDMSERPPSWLRGLADPITCAALAALHADPARAWTVDALAHEVGVSKATLTRRFASEVGLAPRDYLTTWRMEVAAQRLRTGSDPIGAVARSIGYTSEYAFNRAFTRRHGLAPGRYRTTSRHHS
jgi:AraC-like DNA-binding protein